MPDEMETEVTEMCVTAAEKHSGNNEVMTTQHIILSRVINVELIHVFTIQ